MCPRRRAMCPRRQCPCPMPYDDPRHHTPCAYAPCATRQHPRPYVMCLASCHVPYHTPTLCATPLRPLPLCRTPCPVPRASCLAPRALASRVPCASRAYASCRMPVPSRSPPRASPHTPCPQGRRLVVVTIAMPHGCHTGSSTYTPTHTPSYLEPTTPHD
jgi:hypothetical protein